MQPSINNAPAPELPKAPENPYQPPEELMKMLENFNKPEKTKEDTPAQISSSGSIKVGDSELVTNIGEQDPIKQIMDSNGAKFITNIKSIEKVHTLIG